jgi:hypothetical protein
MLFRSILVASLMAGLTPLGFADLTYISIDAPGATRGTVATGINDQGQIVGWYLDATSYHGFLDMGGVFSNIDVPGTQTTIVSGINDFGQIVGQYSDSTGTHGFLYSAGTFTSLDYPKFPGDHSGQNTIARGVNNSGQIVGLYGNATGMHGFLDDHGSFSTIDYAGTTQLNLFGVNDPGQIVGVSAGPNGYLYSGGSFSAINCPGGSGGTEPFDINNQGLIVGEYVVANVQQGFLDAGGDCSTIAFPGATFGTVAFGVNDSGAIVGQYGDSDQANGLHGFLAVPQAAAVPEPSALPIVLGVLIGVVGFRTLAQRRSRQLLTPEAASHVIVYHAGGLHKGVTDGRANEGKAALR